MIELAGEYLESRWPNRPGLWVYRRLSDNTVLEVELSATEMSQVLEKWRIARQERIRELNRHPLNEAARVLLDTRLEYSDRSQMALLNLVFAAFVEEGRDETDDAMMLVAGCLHDDAKSRAFLNDVIASEEITPEDLRGRSILEAGRLVWEAVFET